MTTKKGKIIKWFDERGFGFIQPEGTKGKSTQVFLHRSKANLPEAKLREGTVVEFEEKPGRKGPQAENARLPGQQAAIPPRGYRFLNPYNFVRYLPYRESDDDDPPAVKLMGRTMPPAHDRWIGLTGKLECQIQAVTPLFVADAEGVTIEKDISARKKHYSYRFFRIDGKKAIPASTLRGVIRSVFEAATNSSFSNFGGERLSYRLPAPEVQKLVPARVEKVEQDDEIVWQLRLLPGAAPFAPEYGQKKGLYAAPARFYTALKPTGRHRNNPPSPIGDPAQWQHGQEYFAILRQINFPPSWRVLDLCDSREKADKKRQEMQRDHREKLVVRQGWLCKTYQNSDNKNSERFFYRDPGRQDVPETLPLSVEVRQKYEALIQDYQVRHQADVKKREDAAHVENGEIAFSRFVLNKKEARLRGGELVYLRLRGKSKNLQVDFMAPVSWPRVAYDHTIGDLLPRYLHPNINMSELDPASRVFGWVHGEGKDRDGAYAGRVRFTHALLQPPNNPLEKTTLSILGSPKPTTTRFYLAGPDGTPSDEPQDAITVGYDGRNGRNRLRGRKFYRHFIPDEKFMTREEQSDQNRTILDAEDGGSKFTFAIEFENLAPVELGALLWSLSLDGNAYHKLGYGKPLGLGSVEIKVTDGVLYDQVGRYQLCDQDGTNPLSPDSQAALVSQFQKAFCQYYVTNQKILELAAEKGNSGWRIVFEDLPNIKDLLTLLDKQAPELPVHYPFAPDLNSKGQFEWFVGNNRLHGPRIELSLATEDKGLPLINKKGNQHE